MLIATIADRTGVEQYIVRSFLSRHKITRTRKQGAREVWVDMAEYVAALRRQGLNKEADRLEGKGENTSSTDS